MLARIHEEMLQSIKHLDESTQGRIILAYINYQLYDIEPSKDDILVYSIFKIKQFDLDSIKNDIQASIINGGKGGRPSKNWENSQKPKHNLKQPNHNLTEPEKEKEKEKEKENNIKKKIKNKKKDLTEEQKIEIKNKFKDIQKKFLLKLS